jgi:hypothetical protein
MKFTRGKRIALELLGPPLLGGALATLWAWGALVYLSCYQYESLWDVARLIPVMWLFYGVFAFPMISIQAAGYAAVMEWRFSRGLSPRSWRAVALSTVLGYLSGLPLAIGYGYARKDTWYLFNILGPVIGLVLGLMIRRFSKGQDRK